MIVEIQLKEAREREASQELKNSQGKDFVGLRCTHTHLRVDTALLDVVSLFVYQCAIE